MRKEMKNIDIKSVELSINLPEILNAIASKAFFEIDINGRIYINERAKTNMPIIFRHKQTQDTITIMDANALVKHLLKDFNPTINAGICKIKPLIAWAQVIELNRDRMLYFDHQSDGVELFEDKELEDMGWEATALDISYRQLCEHIENTCEGCLVFYDNDIQFNGFVIANDIKEVRLSVKTFIIQTIQNKIQNDELDTEDYDVSEALAFFGVNV
jgi:hypothetical protein